MARYQDGELIPLYFEDYQHPEYIKGEVSLDEAQSVIGREFGGEKRVVSIVHKYGFWGVGVHPVTSDPCQVFMGRSKPGRGRFKVTECECVYLDNEPASVGQQETSHDNQ